MEKMNELTEVDDNEMTILADYQARHRALELQTIKVILYALGNPSLTVLLKEVENWKQLYKDIYGHSGKARAEGGVEE